MVTIFQKLKDTENPYFEDVITVLNSFKDGSNKQKIETLRTIKDKEKYSLEKSKLKSICFSGEFSRRAAKNCISHSGFACLDFDNVPDAICLRDSLQDNEYIFSAFISPGGNGVKAIVKIPAEIENHKKYYEALCETFDSFLDSKTKDISRVCFESYDKDLFINENSKVWILKKEYTEVTQSNKYPKHFIIQDTNKKVDVIIKWFNKKFTLNAGERNNNLFKLASGLNKAGNSKEDTLQLFLNYYSSGLTETEIVSLINSAYKNASEFDTLVLVDDNKIKDAREVLKKGVQKAKKELRKEGLKEDEIEDVLDFDFESDFLIFWDINKNGKISLNDYKFKLFLENRGFYRFIIIL